MRFVGILVSIAILGALMVVWLYYGTGGASGGGASNPAAPPPASRVGEARQAAESVECRNNLSQIRAAIQMRTTTDETDPASLNELVQPASMLVWPVSQPA